MMTCLSPFLVVKLQVELSSKLVPAGIICICLIKSSDHIHILESYLWKKKKKFILSVKSFSVTRALELSFLFMLLLLKLFTIK